MDGAAPGACPVVPVLSKGPVLNQTEKEFLSAGRVAHLATTGARGHPLVVPICYAFEDAEVYSSIDAKAKRIAPLLLERAETFVKILMFPLSSIDTKKIGRGWPMF